MRKIIFYISLFLGLVLFAQEKNSNEEIQNFENEEFFLKAKVYENETSSEKNEMLAFDYYEISAHKNSNPLAFEYLKKCAENGNPHAQYFFGLYYFNPNTRRMDNDKAFYWFEKAAKKNHSRAIWAISHCYDRGIGVKEDTMKAFILYRLAEVILILQEDSGFKVILEEQAKERFSDYSHWSSFLIFGGSRESRKDFNQNFKNLMTKANAGDSTSQAILGNEYFEGYFLNKNYKKAFGWWKKASENGNASSTYALGLCYFLGDGVDKDFKKAFECFLEADKNGLPTIELARSYMEAWGTQKNDDKALEIFTKILNGDKILACKFLLAFRENKKLKNYNVKAYSKIYKTSTGGDHLVSPLD